METLVNRLKLHEGYRLTPYRDTNGYWTIGRGHRIKKYHVWSPKPNIVWTPSQAEEQFLKDVYQASDEFMRWKRTHYPTLDLVRSEVCVELVFWMGLNAFAGFVCMHEALAAADYKLAALELYNSKIGKDKRLRMRARDLAELLWEGQP
jgi:lysozyme